MIQTKELRAGNKVSTKKGDIISVQQILNSTIIYDSKIEVQREYAIVKGGYTGNSFSQLNEVVKEADCQDIAPILLTEDLLRKCGFRNFIREQWILTIGNSHFDWEFLNGNLRLRAPHPCLASIRSLHQLQNFLFMVANYELEVKL